MDQALKARLNNLLKNNKNWPIIIEGGITKEDFLNACIISASIPSSELGVINDIGGLKLPRWVEVVDKKKNDKTNLLVIDHLDSIPTAEQTKFNQILHTKQLNGFKLPENLQIVILINEGNRDKINREILSLSLYYKVE